MELVENLYQTLKGYGNNMKMVGNLLKLYRNNMEMVENLYQTLKRIWKQYENGGKPSETI
jgi:hypothetical protein